MFFQKGRVLFKFSSSPSESTTTHQRWNVASFNPQTRRFQADHYGSPAELTFKDECKGVDQIPDRGLVFLQEKGSPFATPYTFIRTALNTVVEGVVPLTLISV